MESIRARLLTDPDSFDNLINLNPSYAATILRPEGGYSNTLSFKREVFLKEGRPRARLNVALYHLLCLTKQ